MNPAFDTIIITSDEPYSDTWHTQLHYMDYLAGGHDVFFLNPPKKWRPRNLLNFKWKEKRISDTLSIIDYRNILPVFFSLFDRFNEYYNQRLVKQKLKHKKAQSVLIWHFDSFRNCFHHASFTHAFHIKRIYHVIDPFMKNPKNGLLSLLADVIVITSPKNNIHYANYSRKVIHVAQAVNTDLAKKQLRGIRDELFAGNPDYLVLLGTISDDIYFDWLSGLVQDENIHLVIVGKKKRLEKSKAIFETIISKNNVLYTGELPPEKFYPILHTAKAGLVLYNQKKMEQVSSPLKVINYLIAGIPTLTTIDTEISTLNGQCIYTCSDFSQLKSLASKALENKLHFNERSATNYLGSVSLKNAVTTILSKL